MKLPKTQQALLEAMQAGVVIHQCWTPGTGMFFFRHDNLKACTSAGLALIRKGVARTQATGSDKTLVLVDQSAAASLSDAGTAGAAGAAGAVGQAQA